MLIKFIQTVTILAQASLIAMSEMKGKTTLDAA